MFVLLHSSLVQTRLRGALCLYALRLFWKANLKAFPLAQQNNNDSHIEQRLYSENPYIISTNWLSSDA